MKNAKVDSTPDLVSDLHAIGVIGKQKPAPETEIVTLSKMFALRVCRLIEDLRKMHNGVQEAGSDTLWCASCSLPHPCPTTRRIEGYLNGDN